MKPYGVRVIESPDAVDIKFMASKGSTGKFPGKSGEYRPYSRSGQGKSRMRRFWKRKARAEGKREETDFE